MGRYWLLLLAFLACAVDDPDQDPPAADAAPDPDAGADTGDESLDDLVNSLEDEPAPKKVAAEDPVIKEIRARAERAERELAEVRSRPAPVAAPAQRDAEFDREEQIIADLARTGADEATQQWTKWKITQDRAMRAVTQNSTRALSAAEDIRDQTAFDRLEITNPTVYKRYSQRVETAMADMRAKGQNAPRAAVLRLLIGDDIMNGKIKAGPGKKTPVAEPSKTVDRGRTPGARSDVTRGAGSLTERQKRYDRIKDIPL